jgi:GxxExxY protein
MEANAVTGEIVDASYKVHTTLGPGLLESVYEAALAWELEKRGLSVARQQGIPVIYEQVHIHTGFFADLVVDRQIIVEIKAVEVIAPVHRRQLAPGSADQFQRGAHQGRHRPDCQWTERVTSRRGAESDAKSKTPSGI